MSHQIFGERFYATREPAWHGLGQVFKKALKPSVAVKKVGLDYEVHKYPLFAYPAKGKKVESKRFTIMRDPTKDDPNYVEFGTAADKYEIVQNADLANLLDPLAEHWPLETMGGLRDGKIFFATLKAGKTDVKGDEVIEYFMLLDVKDGGTATKMVYTPVRVVCGNTLVVGLRQATVNISVQHITGVHEQLKARVNLIAKAQVAMKETNELFNKMAEKTVKRSLVEDLFSKVYKTPKVPEDAALVDYSEEDLGTVLHQAVSDSMYAFNYYTQQAQEQQAIAIDLFDKMNDEQPKLANSLWHAYNAVVESADYRLGGMAPEESALFGARSREKKRAWNGAMALLKK